MTETGNDRTSGFRGGERDQEKPDQTGDAAPTLDVTPALNDVDEHAAIYLDQDLAGDRGYDGTKLASSRSLTSPPDWDGETLRAVERCHHVAAAHAVGSPMSGIRSIPGAAPGTNTGPAIPPSLI
jgi:hypothetical protein